MRVENISPRPKKDTSPISPKILQKSPTKSQTKSPKSLSSKRNQQKSKSKSPSKSLKKQIQDHQAILQKMKKNRLRLCNTLDTYTLLIRSNNPIRCLQHNSNISIYCQTQQRLLCSNCIFRKIDHKYHKVLPVDKTYEKLGRDIQIMQRQIQRQVQGIQTVYKKIYYHFENQQKFAQDYLKKIQQQYQTARVLLAECQIQSKKKIITELQKSQIKYQSILGELRFLKDVYKDQYLQVPPSKDLNFLLYQHVMCNTVVSQGKFAHAKWGTLKLQMEDLGKREEKNAGDLINLMQTYIEKSLKQK